MATMVRYEPDGGFTVVGNVGSVGKHWPVGSRWPVGGNNTTTLVFETARSVRIEAFDEATGTHIDRAREVGIRSAVGRPSSSRATVGGTIRLARPARRCRLTRRRASAHLPNWWRPRSRMPRARAR
jgi:hypothetical protein